MLLDVCRLRHREVSCRRDGTEKRERDGDASDLLTKGSRTGDSAFDVSCGMTHEEKRTDEMFTDAHHLALNVSKHFA